MPFLLNHYLHMNCVISKFKLGNEFVTDFAYLTKSSDYWEFVLVELEDAKKKIFTNDKENIYFHSEFNHAYDQITSWKAYVNKNREAILHQTPISLLPDNFISQICRINIYSCMIIRKLIITYFLSFNIVVQYNSDKGSGNTLQLSSQATENKSKVHSI